jgi:hypothetical protein
MKNKVILSILAIGMFAFGPTLYGQEDQSKKSQPQEQQQQADRSGEETLTGCLTEQQGSYVIATPSGEQLSVSGAADLSKHKDHTVKLTGKRSEEGGKTKLTVSKIEHVSASCSK